MLMSLNLLHSLFYFKSIVNSPAKLNAFPYIKLEVDRGRL